MFGYYNKYLDSVTFKMKGLHKYVEFRFSVPDYDVLGVKEMLLNHGWPSVEVELSYINTLILVASRSLDGYLRSTVPDVKCDIVFQ